MTLDWRSYFTTNNSEEFHVEKANPYHDALGRFTTGEGAVGGGSAKGATRVNQMGIKAPFNKLPLGKQMQIVKTAIASNKGKGTIGLSRIMYNVSQLTGQHPGADLAKGVAKTIETLNNRGHISIKSEEIPLTDKNGHIVLRKLEDRVFTGDARKDFEANVVTRKSVNISLTPAGTVGIKGMDIKHTGDITRPAKYETEANTPAGKFLEQRRETYKDTATAVMGRYFSSNKLAPEMTHKYTDKKVEELNKARNAAKAALDKTTKGSDEWKKALRDFSTADHKAQVGAYLNANRAIREVAHKDKEFFDATSSVNGIIGAMTGNQSMLANSRLHEGYNKEYPHSKTLEHFGIKAAFKPYFANTMSGAAGTLTVADFKGIGTKGAESPKDVLKEAAKKLFTPGTYGSNIHGALYEVKTGPHAGTLAPASGGTKGAAKVLEESGMSRALAISTAAKMAENFKSSPLVNFNQSFRQLIAHAPEGFVYENPMSGFKMSFDKYSRNKYEEQLSPSGKPVMKLVKNKDGGTVALSRTQKITGEDGSTINLRIPYVNDLRAGRQTNSGAAALFVQNWDAAIITQLGTDLKSAHTLHDAIGIKKGQEKDLHRYVANAYNKLAKLDPIGNLAKQIIAEHKRQFKITTPKPTTRDLKKLASYIRAIQSSLLNVRNSTRNPGQPEFTNHNQHNLGNVNVPPTNEHFEKE